MEESGASIARFLLYVEDTPMYATERQIIFNTNMFFPLVCPKTSLAILVIWIYLNWHDSFKVFSWTKNQIAEVSKYGLLIYWECIWIVFIGISFFHFHFTFCSLDFEFFCVSLCVTHLLIFPISDLWFSKQTKTATLIFIYWDTLSNLISFE